jgi:hypothetical protein
MTPIQILKTAFIQMARGLWPALHAVWPMLLTLHVLDLLFSQYSNWLQGMIMQKGDPSIALLVLLFLSTGAFQLLWSAAWLLCLAPVFRGWLTQPPGSLSQTLPAYGRSVPFRLLVIEQMRVFAKVLLWLPLLVLPAFYQYIRLIFVPLVVVFDPQYQNGQADALQRSREITQRHLGLIVLVLLIAFGIPVLLESLAQGDSDFIWENPVHIGLVSIMMLFVNLASSIFLFSAYRSLSTVQGFAPTVDLLNGGPDALI